MHLPLSTVQKARYLLARYLPRTRLAPSPSLSRRSAAKVFLKLEGELPTGSFKPRGALYALSVNMARGRLRGVVASSTGNHGAAVAYAAQRLGVPAVVFLPENANPVKRARIAELGATIFESGRDIRDAFRGAAAYARAENLYFLNDATDPDLPTGPAAIACEILEELPDTDAIYVPMGDTALIRGIAAAAKQISRRVQIIGVQAERAPSYYLSWQQGHAVTTPDCDTIADGLATRIPEAENVRAIRELVDDLRLVSEERMLSAIRHLWLEDHVVAEPAGAASTAALLGHGGPLRGNIILIASGANVAPEITNSVLAGDSATLPSAALQSRPE
ncbi:MAG TPA: threonine/serine dehydratase [Bryobacteraceae bacterium]|nr:threonine/serine dehydratase [Bryobacteraceae bacterium]